LSEQKRSLVWFRSDLRVHDNPALFEAMADSDVVAVFCLAPAQWRAHDVGNNRLAFLLRSLGALSHELARLNVPLVLLDTPWFADVPMALIELAGRIDAGVLAFNAEYPLNERRRDDAVAEIFAAARIRVRIHHGSVVLPPGSVRTAADTAYTVFTPFRRRWLEVLPPDQATPLPVPVRQRDPGVAGDPVPGRLDGVSPEQLAEQWPAGESEALGRLDAFASSAIGDYARQRDMPGVAGTSSLSPYLSVGAVSPRRCLMAAGASTAWRDELIWREFYRHVIASFDHVSRGHAFKERFDAIPWRTDPEAFSAWRDGKTGYPLVDAGMRQLLAIGWMHNRVRMVTAMFLSKHLLIDWRWGERHFMHYLVDGDFAANNGGWQWSASTGTDAAPYFRVFNPASQAKKYDPQGRYVRRWVKELADDGSAAVMDYPPPIVDQRQARERALATFKALR
jgi:deoxyribodipyrimidine photo-lyase